jgi:Fe-S-cluster containining protein
MLDLKVKCGKCASCCCYAIPVITHYDVKRIAKATGMSPISFVKMYSPGEISSGQHEEGWVKMEGGRRVMGLKQVRGRCIFLAGDNNCKVYKARPVTCRTYPFHIELDRKGRIRALGFQEKASYKGRTCSAVPKIARDDKRLLKDAKKEDREDRSYWDKCEQWSKSRRKKRTLKKFLTFLGL